MTQILDQLLKVWSQFLGLLIVLKDRMLSWQLKNKQKLHNLAVENAKPSIKRQSISRQRNTSRSKNQHKQPRAAPSIDSILDIFGLGQYSHLFMYYRFAESLASNNQTAVASRILKQVPIKDKQRVSSLINTLVIMSKTVKDQMSTPSTLNNSKKKDTELSSNSHSKSIKSNLRTIKKNEKSAPKFRIKPKAQQRGQNTSVFKLESEGNLKPIINLKQSKQTFAKRSLDRKNKLLGSRVGKTSLDDLSYIHHFKVNQETATEVQLTTESSKLIKRLASKIQQIEKPSGKEDLQLQYDKIKDMYLSFDSGTLNSNLINVDAQEMSQCLAKQVVSMMVADQTGGIVEINRQTIRQLLSQSIIECNRRRGQSQITQKINPESESFLPEQTKYPAEVEQQLEFDTDKSQEEAPDEDRQSGQKQLGQESSIWGTNYITSVIEDFSCFDSFGLRAEKLPEVEDVKNFIDLLMMSGKMEKEIPILAFVYVSKLLGSTKQAKLTARNWRNIVLITMIEASKIWDDQSFENHSFAKILPEFTTLQINRLEKYLLFFMDYRLTVEQKQYCQSYFTLRAQSPDHFRTVHLHRLDVRTILKLQRSGKHEDAKKDYLQKCLNKSF